MKIGDTIVVIKGFATSASKPFKVNIVDGSRLQIVDVVTTGVKVKQNGGRELLLTHNEVRSNCQVPNG
jgi:hypothetical protein